MLLQKERLAKKLREKMGAKSQIDFANWLKQQGTEVNQATISRLLNGRCKTATPKVRVICKYAGIDVEEYVRKELPQKNPFLMSALGQVWDGSPEHAAWLARLIRTAGSAP